MGIMEETNIDHDPVANRDELFQFGFPKVF